MDFTQNVDTVVPLGGSCRQVVTRGQMAKASQPHASAAAAGSSDQSSAPNPSDAEVQPSPAGFRPIAAVEWVQGYTCEEL